MSISLEKNTWSIRREFIWVRSRNALEVVLGLWYLLFSVKFIPLQSFARHISTNNSQLFFIEIPKFYQET